MMYIVAALRLRDNSRYRIYKGQLLRVSVVRALTQRSRYVRPTTRERLQVSTYVIFIVTLAYAYVDICSAVKSY